MKDFFRKYILVIGFSAIGALGGFLYWKFVGCMSGTCMIKSVWYLSTFYGLLLGYITGQLIEELILKFKKQKKI